MARKRRRRFSREFNIEAVQLARQEGVPLSQVARDLGAADAGRSLCQRGTATALRSLTLARPQPSSVADRA